MGLGSITFSLPHFLSGPYMAGNMASGANASADNMCRASALNAASNRMARAGTAGADGSFGVTHPLAVEGGGMAVAAAAGGAAPEDIAAVEGLLETLPGLDKIKSLTQGQCNQPLFTSNRKHRGLLWS